MRARFSEIKKSKRGDALDPLVNQIPRDAVKRIEDEALLGLFDEAESKRWYGELLYPVESGQIEFKFRHGVCQFFKIVIPKGKAFFRLNVINSNVDFRGDAE
jgi:hypothetical protein